MVGPLYANKQWAVFVVVMLQIQKKARIIKYVLFNKYSRRLEKGVIAYEEKLMEIFVYYFIKAILPFEYGDING
ncbi:hypothetical protein DTO10_01670 [Peribacillus butanolivorans]|uniref:Transposase n=1 Tax=Peribacillus butanolivorans TaxID=421767 RepID=A0ABM6XFZ2_9BACI|nr:hypothetical protein DTO10_01670 [Peribacillus butanolivorans]